MEFGAVPAAAAAGAILAHSLMLDGRRLRKGQLLGPEEVAALVAGGVGQVTVARLGPADVAEDRAAARLAAALVPDGAAAGLVRSDAFTGRVNLNAVGPGIVELDAAAVHALNRVDPAITFATLAPFARVAAGMLAGTVKIIAYGVAEAALAEAEALARGAIRVRPVDARVGGASDDGCAGAGGKADRQGPPCCRGAARRAGHDACGRGDDGP